MARRGKSEKPILWVVRQPQGLIPATPFDLDMIERYRIGSRLSVTVEQPRDEALNRFIHGLIKKVADGIGEDPDSLKWWLKVEAGLRREFNVQIDGSTSIIPKSFDEIDQAEFQAFVDRAVEIITTRIVPGASTDEIMSKTWEYVGIPDEI